ncbi:hypothetical protein [Aestuariicoccus sp. MJ-SS9]|uniref:hypothetical protein n=1 Tax=Aestuariicoccus sp. MJ-SS9 TaxID=3079855 RepID=UPI00290C1B01|nr:hypothetical protein [Aestuariicoccus sp. MJ-SS9]MDU8910252.1 hypothetical protein [Aestuariicoccus sp. MJ-SS9]
MPQLVRLYIRQCLSGFGIAAFFVAGLLYLDVAHLGHLVQTSPLGWVAAAMLWVFHGALFGAVQFAITILGMAEDDSE